MNWDAFYERDHNRRYIRTAYRQGSRVLEIQRLKVRFKGHRWADLSTYDKRKFETNLLLEHMDNQKLPTKFLYV